MRILVLAALLVACSGEPGAPSPDIAGTTTQAVPQARRSVPPTPVPATVTPKPGELRTFGDWTVACDNGLTCTMASLGPEIGQPPEFTVAITRAAGADGGVEFMIDGHADADLDLAIDGRAVQPEWTARLYDELARGWRLTVSYGGRTIETISLKGAAAAMRYLDDRQGRAGTVTAWVAKGSATRVPSAPPLPVVRAVMLGGDRVIPAAAQLAEMNRLARCEMPAGIEVKPESVGLGGGGTLAILPCSAGAYNVSGALFVLEDGRIRPAALDAPAGFDADSRTPVPSIVNGSVKAGLLVGTAKGRGLGDCGVTQRFAWDGARFRLVEQRAMGECRGNPNYLVTWRVRVERVSSAGRSPRGRASRG